MVVNTGTRFDRVVRRPPVPSDGSDPGRPKTSSHRRGGQGSPIATVAVALRERLYPGGGNGHDMTERGATAEGWFAGLDSTDVEGAAEVIDEGGAEESADWPAAAVESVVESEAEYYDWLHEATLAAARAGAQRAERADDQQLIHAVRAMDDIARYLT